MNIIKLNDKLMHTDDNPTIAELFNKELKGKYAYWIKMRYIFPLESLSYCQYIDYEQRDEMFFLGDKVLPHIDTFSEEACLYDFINNYVDVVETERINGIQNYLNSNKITSDYDLDIDNLRNFRSWLATELIKFGISDNGNDLNLYTTEQLHMLEYYKEGMYNDVVKYLNIFGSNTSINYITSNTSCGCCNSNISGLYNSVLNTCDALSVYRNNIHNTMVKTFSNVDFWKMFNVSFMKLFKKYIDNIIKSGLLITYNDSKLILECDCSYSISSSSNKILENLSTALDYIINGEISGHINYIYDALYNWADKLYDNMSWEIK